MYNIAKMASQKALYDLCGIKFKSKFSILAVSTKDLMSLALLKLGFGACAETFLQGHKKRCPARFT